MTSISTWYIRKSLVALILATSCLVIMVGPAHATVIDFNSFPSGTFVSYTESGVTFSTVGGGGAIIGDTTPNSTKGIHGSNIPYKELQADISSHASFVSVDLGDFDGDSDLLFLEVFNALNVSVGFTSVLIGVGFTGMVPLSLSAPDIAYAQFGARFPAVNGSSVFADNFTYTLVPEPNSFILAGFGIIALLAVAARRRRRVAK